MEDLDPPPQHTHIYTHTHTHTHTQKSFSMNHFLAGAQEVAMPAVSMSEKLKHHQKSLLCGKHHVTYTNLHRSTWQREEERRHRCHATWCIYFLQIKYTVKQTVGRISMVPWLWFQLKMLQNIECYVCDSPRRLKQNPASCVLLMHNYSCI